jgi:hypothetical protein
VKENDLNIEGLIDAFVVKHKPIEEYFFKDKGIKLQNIDSRIAEKVINHFTNLKIPVLCIHDSFVIAAAKSKELLEVMRKCFITVLNELKLPIMNPRTTNSGLGIDQWYVIQSDPNWIDFKLSLYRERYDYPEWDKRMNQFRERDVKDYYHT